MLIAHKKAMEPGAKKHHWNRGVSAFIRPYLYTQNQAPPMVICSVMSLPAGRSYQPDLQYPVQEGSSTRALARH